MKELDPAYVLAFLVFLAAFAAGQELSQMTLKRKTVAKSEPRWVFPAYCLTIVGIIVAGVLIVQTLSNVIP